MFRFQYCQRSTTTIQTACNFPVISFLTCIEILILFEAMRSIHVLLIVDYTLKIRYADIFNCYSIKIIKLKLECFSKADFLIPKI